MSHGNNVRDVIIAHVISGDAQSHKQTRKSKAILGPAGHTQSAQPAHKNGWPKIHSSSMSVPWLCTSSMYVQNAMAQSIQVIVAWHKHTNLLRLSLYVPPFEELATKLYWSSCSLSGLGTGLGISKVFIKCTRTSCSKEVATV